LGESNKKAKAIRFQAPRLTCALLELSEDGDIELKVRSDAKKSSYIVALNFYFVW
jgi:hypothetical protein